MIECEEVKITNNKDGTYKVFFTSVPIHTDDGEIMCNIEYPTAKLEISPLKHELDFTGIPVKQKANQTIDLVPTAKEKDGVLYNIYVPEEESIL